ncbi:hypothetical protein [Acetobacter conturbans]|uniref:Uncharacterized protein n=1 Tax=Acetobacter conturbans TaxID=1737472 RepID=A0ABX0K063_9PROT|nr:hypothetical protein [Acetobacter conturbans]NHN88206.1 hypothetical protein [Acetobacter conturbans]
MSAQPRFIPRLLIALALAYPVGLAITTLLPRLFHGSPPDAFFVAQAEAIGAMPIVILTLFAARTLIRGLLAGAAVIVAVLLVTLPFAALGAP